MTPKRPPTKAKRDANEGPIRDALRAIGCQVTTIDLPADLLVYDPVTDLIILVEVKGEGKRADLTPAECRFHTRMPALNLWIVCDPQEAVDKIFKWRAAHAFG